MEEPIWLTRQVLELIHQEQLAEHGGRPGLRDENSLESALARPRQRRSYDQAASLPALAATLCIGLARNHPFIDGNKRVALLAAYTFLGLNGLKLAEDEVAVAELIESVAAGSVEEATLAQWISDHIQRR